MWRYFSTPTLDQICIECGVDFYLVLHFMFDLLFRANILKDLSDYKDSSDYEVQYVSSSFKNSA